MALSYDDVRRLLAAHAPPRPVPLVPSLEAYWADDELPLWSALEDEGGEAVGPPFFCMPWPGAQALALAVEQRLVELGGKRVLDVGCGSGLAAVAAARRGADVLAVDVDVLACACARALAEHNGARGVRVAAFDALACPALGARFDAVLAGDVVYSRGQAQALARAVEVWRSAGALVLLADSGRPFFTSCGLPCVLEVDAPVPRSIDGADVRRASVYLGGA